MSDQENQQELELELEQRVREIAHLIDSSQPEPERRSELGQMVLSLLQQELLHETETIAQTERVWIRKPMNPLALGLLFLILGGGFLFILPPMGLIFALFGVVGIIWGVLAGVLPTRTVAKEKTAESIADSAEADGKSKEGGA